MFEAVELGQKISKEEYRKRIPKLRASLIEAQQAVLQANLSVMIVVAGLDGAGKGEVVHRLNEWMDPRGIDTHTFWNPSGEEEERPYFWRFWRTMPARGRLAIYYGGWYNDLLLARVHGKIGRLRLEYELARIAAFERMLVEDGTLIVKFWFHLAKKDQRRRLEALAKRPDQYQVVLPDDRKRLRLHAGFVSAGETMIRRTDTGFAPWHLVEASQDRHRSLTAGQLLLDTLQTRLDQAPLAKPKRKAKNSRERRPTTTVLDHVDLTQSIDEEAYDKARKKLQVTLNRLTWKAYERGRSTILVFEGWDAAGKGSAIRRITEAVDARLFRIVPVAAPSEDERAHHYLWRFWRHLSRAGRLTIFDRSWYGRVLVERLEGFASQPEWSRAYHEINAFERQLSEHGVLVLKFWIHISQAEQLARFRKREQVAHKNYKITPEDWRNRKRWGQYKHAVHDMVTRTSTEHAPWILVAGNDKRHARLQILSTYCQALKQTLR